MMYDFIVLRLTLYWNIVVRRSYLVVLLLSFVVSFCSKEKSGLDYTSRYLSRDGLGQISEKEGHVFHISKYWEVNPERPSMVFFSEIVENTQGDVSSTSKVIRELGNHDIDSFWVIRSKTRNFSNLEMIPKNTKVILISDWDILFEDAVKNTLSQIKTKLAYPTFHYLNEKQTNFLQNLPGKFYRMTEYDFMESYDDSSIDTLRTGFGDDCLGVMLDGDQLEGEVSFKNRDNQRLYELMSKSGQDFYFAYFNQWTNYEDQDSYTSLSGYLEMAIFYDLLKKAESYDQTSFPKSTFLLVALGQDKSKDLLLDLHNRMQAFIDHSDLDLRYKQLIRRIQFNYSSGVGFEGGDLKTDFSIQSESNDDPIIFHIVNPFPLLKNDMQIFMRDSSSFVGVTGDQSLTEAIQYKKVVYYQVMQWKRMLLDQFVNTSKLFPYIHKFYKSYGQKSKLELDEVWQWSQYLFRYDKKLKRDSRDFLDYLKREKNLTQNLGKIFVRESLN